MVEYDWTCIVFQGIILMIQTSRADYPRATVVMCMDDEIQVDVRRRNVWEEM